jgi:hypothetical protein
MQPIASHTATDSAAAGGSARNTPFRIDVLGERFAVTRRAGARGGRVPTTGRGPLLNDIMAALFEGDVRTAMSKAYGEPFASPETPMVLIRHAETSGAFILDHAHRRRALELLCRHTLGASGLLVLHPPTTQWHAADPEARFRLHGCRSKDLLLCVLMGALGFAQLCDARLLHPVPLLIQPWCAERGLLRPERLPTKSFSRSLCVHRLGDKRLLLFDKRCATTP